MTLFDRKTEVIKPRNSKRKPRVSFSDRHFRRNLVVTFYKTELDSDNVRHFYYQGNKKVHYGQETVKFGDNGQEYFIDYDNLIPKAKYWEYFADIDSAIDSIGLGFKHEVVNNAHGTVPATQAGKYHDTIVNEAYTKETGISKTMLMIALIGMCISGAIAGIMAINYMDASQQEAHDHPLLLQYQQAYPPPQSTPAKGTATNNQPSGAIIVHH